MGNHGSLCPQARLLALDHSECSGLATGGNGKGNGKGQNKESKRQGKQKKNTKKKCWKAKQESKRTKEVKSDET